MTASAARKNNRDDAENGKKSKAGQATEGLDYEAARDELVEVVRRLEAGGLSLEDSLALWERGEALAATCERQLAGARDRIETALSRVENSDAEPPEND